jgi:putative ABC transport system permease protein
VSAGRGLVAARPGLLPWRGLLAQSRRDLAPLVVGLLVVAASAFLAAAVPQTLADVATTVVQDAVATSGRSTDVVVDVRLDSGYGPSAETAAASDWVGSRVEAGMPAELRGVLAPPVTALVGPELKAGTIGGRPGRIRFIYVSSAAGPALDWVEGRAPAAAEGEVDPSGDDNLPPVEVALSQQAAELIGVHAGSPLTVQSLQGEPLDVRLSGVYRPADPGDDAWHVAPTLLKPQLVDGSAAVAAVGLMVSAESLPAAQLISFPTEMNRTFTYRAVASKLDAGRAEALATQARALAAGRATFDIAGGQPAVYTNFDAVIGEALARVAAASAQASVLLFGVLASAVLVELLIAGLLVERRAAVLLQWRARGASLPVVAVANLAEAGMVTAVGGGLGVVAAALLADGAPPLAWVLPMLAAAVVPQPMLAVRAAAGSTRPVPAANGRRPPVSAAKVRRVAAEVMAAMVAVAALTTLVARGVTASAGSVWSDVVVLAAPVLVALVVALGLVRSQSRASALARSLAARTSGAVPLLAAARMRGEAFSVAALVVACAMAAIATTVSGTVRSGQVEAAWDAVGAEAAVSTNEASGLPAAVERLDGDAGLALATAAVIPGAQLLGPGIDRPVTVVAVDAEAFGRLLAAATSAGGSSPAEAVAALALIATPNQAAVPVLVAGLPNSAAGIVRWGDERVDVQALGTVPTLPPQLRLTGQPTVLADRVLLGRALGHEVAASHAWVVGPLAVPRLEEALAGADALVTTREGWLAAQVDAPLPHALGWLFTGAWVVATALAALAVILMAASGARQRTRAAAQLRVVGMRGAAARRVAWLEAALPAVLASAVGVAVGMGLSGLLVVALDLKSVTGGRHAPHLVTAWSALGLPVALGVLSRVAVGIAGLRSGREAVGPMMRAG